MRKEIRKRVGGRWLGVRGWQYKEGEQLVTLLQYSFTVILIKLLFFAILLRNCLNLKIKRFKKS